MAVPEANYSGFKKSLGRQPLELRGSQRFRQNDNLYLLSLLARQIGKQ